MLGSDQRNVARTLAEAIKAAGINPAQDPDTYQKMVKTFAINLTGTPEDYREFEDTVVAYLAG